MSLVTLIDKVFPEIIETKETKLSDWLWRYLYIMYINNKYVIILSLKFGAFASKE